MILSIITAHSVSMKLQRLVRQLHRTLAPIVMLPLLVTVTTGVTYRLSKDWLGLTRDQVHFLMSIHEGEYLGSTLEPFYVLFNGLGLLWMIATGGVMVVKNIRQSLTKAAAKGSHNTVSD
jgi:hypothetical protein